MAVEALNEFLISESNNQLYSMPDVKLRSDSMKLTYPLAFQSFIDLKKDLDIVKLNKGLNVRLFPGKGGEIVFKVTDVDIHKLNHRYIIIINLEYKYVENVSSTYFSIVPPELLPLIGSKLINIDDIKSICAGFNICEDSNFWEAMFRYNFKEVYDAYVKLGQPKFMNMNSYLAFSMFKSKAGVKIRKYKSTDYLDYYGMVTLDRLLKPQELLMLRLAILYIKHPNTYKAVKSDVFLSDNSNAVSRILLFDLDKFNDIINKVMSRNQPIETQNVLDVSSYDIHIFDNYYGDLDYVLYTFLIMLDFRGIIPNENNIDSTFLIINNIILLESTFAKYYYDKYSLLRIPLLINYMYKIKEENSELYQEVLESLSLENWRYIRQVIMKHNIIEK